MDEPKLSVKKLKLLTNLESHLNELNTNAFPEDQKRIKLLLERIRSCKEPAEAEPAEDVADKVAKEAEAARRAKEVADKVAKEAEAARRAKEVADKVAKEAEAARRAKEAADKAAKEAAEVATGAQSQAKAANVATDETVKTALKKVESAANDAQNAANDAQKAANDAQKASTTEDAITAAEKAKQEAENATQALAKAKEAAQEVSQAVLAAVKAAEEAARNAQTKVVNEQQTASQQVNESVVTQKIVNSEEIDFDTLSLKDLAETAIRNTETKQNHFFEDEINAFASIKDVGALKQQVQNLKNNFLNPPKQQNRRGGGTDLKDVLFEYINLVKIITGIPNVIRLTGFTPENLKKLFSSTGNQFQIYSTFNEIDSTLNELQSVTIFGHMFFIDITKIADVKYKPDASSPVSLFNDIFDNYKKNVESDTEKAIQIMLGKRKYIFVDTFIQILEEIYNERTNEAITNFVLKHLVIYIYNMVSTGMLNALCRTALALKNDDDKTKAKKLNQAIIANMSNTLLTYVKFRSDRPQVYNRRFNIKVENQNLLVKYNDHNFPYYTKETIIDSEGKQVNTFRVSDDVSKYQDQFNDNTSTTVLGLTPKQYKLTYFLGPFTKIFMPKDTNENVARNMQEIQEQLQQGKNVFVIGYGASGSGKTSALVQLNNTINFKTEPGILIHVCNNFAKAGWGAIEFYACEFFVKPDSMEKNDTIFVKQTPCNPSTTCIKLNFENDEFKCINESWYEQYFNKDSPTRINFKGMTLPQIMLTVIESDRYVKATPNNPVSSRSHVMIILKFKKSHNVKSELKPTLIIGDFAGVENKFVCDDLVTLGSFGVIRDKLHQRTDFYTDGRITSIPPNSQGTCVTRQSGGVDNFYFPTLSSEMPISNNIFSLEQYRAIERCIIDCLDMDVVKDMINAKLFDDNKFNGLFDEAKKKFDKKMMIFDIIFGLNGTIPGKYFDRNDIEKTIPKLSSMSAKSKPTLQSGDIKKYLKRGIIGIGVGNLRTMLFKHIVNFIETFKNVKDETIAEQYINNFDQMSTESTIGKSDKFIFNSEQSNIKGQLTNAYTKKPSRFTLKHAFATDTHRDFTNYTNFGGTATSIAAMLQGKPANFEEVLYEIGIWPFKVGDKPEDYKLDGTFAKKYITVREALQKIKQYYNSKFVTSMFDISLKDVVNDGEIVDKVYERFKAALDIENSKVNSIWKGVVEMKQAEVFYKLLDDIFDYVRSQMLIMFKDGKKDQLVEICKMRTKEGVMINETLAQFRNLIEEIIVQKNSDLIQFVPPFDDKCYEYYCKNNRCFNELQKSYNNNNSMTKILNFMLGENWKSNSVISILCIVNLSLDANNPPPTPFIDINNLKIQFELVKASLASGQKADIRTFLQAGSNIIDLIENAFENVTYNLRIPEMYTTFKSICNTTTTYEITKDDFQNKQLDTNISNFIEWIEQSNAVTTMGTLEYVDRLSKFNLANVMCDKSTIDESKYKDILSFY